jgi:hypothetical protein
MYSIRHGAQSRAGTAGAADGGPDRERGRDPERDAVPDLDDPDLDRDPAIPSLPSLAREVVHAG